MSQIISNYPLRIGVQLHPQHTTYQSFIDTVCHVEDMGVDTIWNWDHFFPLWGDLEGCHFESWTLLTAMATHTKRAQIGCLVTCNNYRNPSLLANMAKTVDHICNGRLIFGIGAGWCERDYKEYGYEFGTAGSRIAALEEAIPVILHRWKEDAPRPIRYPIPLLIGGSGEKKTLRIVAEYADIWHGFGGTKTLTHTMHILDQWCSEVGRNPSEIERSTQISKDDSEQKWDACLQAGITHFILDMETPWNFDTLEILIQWRNKRIKE